jgi:hypothetical protein
MDTWGRGGHFGLQPTSGDRILWYAGRNAEAGGKDDEHIRRELLELFGRWHDPIPAVIEATPEASLVRHPMTPDLGQGACQAIIDGAVLASCLSGAADVPLALYMYRRSRYRNAGIAVLFSRVWGGAAQWEGRLTCAVRDNLVRAMPFSLQLRQLDLVIQKPANR